MAAKPGLAGRTVVVSLDLPDLARRLAGEGASVVLVGDDGERAGALLAELETAGHGRGQAAWFKAPATGHATDAELDALVELLAEHFLR